jgi:hypothetical protein
VSVFEEVEEIDVYGVAAEFDDPTALVDAAKAAREAGYRRMEAYSPYAIEELHETIPVLDFVPAICLIGGLLGAATAWIMEYGIAAIDYPINVGGRPLYSWPAFIPILFELTVLCAGTSAFFGAVVLCGFPRPHHPLFNIPQFAHASSSRFFLCIESRDPMFDRRYTAEFLEEQRAIGVWEVEDT